MVHITSIKIQGRDQPSVIVAEVQCCVHNQDHNQTFCANIQLFNQYALPLINTLPIQSPFVAAKVCLNPKAHWDQLEQWRTVPFSSLLHYDYHFVDM